MSEMGNECPVCGRRLEGKSCACGWGSSEKENLTPCDGCGTPTRLSQLTTASPDPGNDDARPRIHRCASCHIAYLKRRAELDPISPEDLARCKAQLATFYARAEAKWGSRRA